MTTEWVDDVYRTSTYLRRSSLTNRAPRESCVVTQSRQSAKTRCGCDCDSSIAVPAVYNCLYKHTSFQWSVDRYNSKSAWPKLCAHECKRKTYTPCFDNKNQRDMKSNITCTICTMRAPITTPRPPSPVVASRSQSMLDGKPPS